MMFNKHNIIIGILLMAMMHSALAQDRRLRPSGDAISACIAKSEGESCFYRNDQNEPISGKCVKSDERHKACTKRID